ncbi:hypothetical protein B9K09_11305 [Pseudomonas sp. M30-35]|nr:hypothetical protein B9K09_11260 [Pseudomonas sp. M30-35]ARU88514.1 hypothetical protein B9K09_11305 [Pseudomonas sp. M30-35]
MTELIAPDGVVIEAPADGWRSCECDSQSDGSDWCDDCKERFEQSWSEGFDGLGRPHDEC